MNTDKDQIPSASEFIIKNSHLSNEDMLKKFAKLHVHEALKSAYEVSKLDKWESNLIFESYPQTKIK